MRLFRFVALFEGSLEVAEFAVGRNRLADDQRQVVRRGVGIVGSIARLRGGAPLGCAAPSNVPIVVIDCRAFLITLDYLAGPPSVEGSVKPEVADPESALVVGSGAASDHCWADPLIVG